MLTNTESKTEELDMQQRISTERIMLLNQNLLLSTPANFLCVLIVFIGLYKVVNQTGLIAWFIAAITTFVLNYALFIFNHYHPISSRIYLICLISFAFIYGALWGVAGTFLMPSGNIMHQMLVLIIVIGVASGGLHTLQANMTASILFFTVILIPVSLWFFSHDGPTHLLLGFSFLVYFGFILMVSWFGNRLLKTNFNLRYKNLDLIEKLIISNNILEESESRFRSAFDSAAIGMALVSLEGRWLKVNDALCQIVGYSADELLSIDFQTITYPEDLDLDSNHAQQLLAGEINSYHIETRYIHKNGGTIWILLNVSLIRDPQKKPFYFIEQIQNIDSKKRAEQELKFIAYHDVLTGLSNRKQLDLSFAFALAHAQRHLTQIAVMFMDLDHFKEVNDKFGHDIGDLLLIKIALRLKASLRSTDILVRLGGDEFIVVLTEVSHKGQVLNVAKKILNAIAKPMTIKQHQISITGSIGISLYPDDSQDLNILIKKADDALYIVKSTGRNNFSFHAPQDP